MTREKTARALVSSLPLALICLLLPALARAQETSQYDRGTPPQLTAGVSSFGSYMSTDLGTVNLANGSLNFKIPIGQVGGRGFGLPLTLNYSSKVWSAMRGLEVVNDPQPHEEHPVWAVYDSLEGPVDYYNRLVAGWTLGATPVIQVQGTGISESINTQNGCTNYLYVLVKLTVTLPDKGEIELRDDYRDGAPIGALVGANGCRDMDGWRGRRWHATDGSGVIFVSDVDGNTVVGGNLSGTLITPDGTRYHFRDDGPPPFGGSAYLRKMARADVVTDRNGNQIRIGYSGRTVSYTDQLGRVTTVEFDAIDGAETLLARVTLPGYGGQSHQYKLRKGVMNQNYRAGISPQLPVYNGQVPGGGDACSGPAGPYTQLFTGWCGGAERVDDKEVLTQLVLPDGRALTFRYNEYGEVAEVETAAGGKVQYDYAYDALQPLPAGNSPSFEVTGMPSGTGNVRAIDRAVAARRALPDGVNVESYWSYTYGTSGSDGTTEVVARASDNSTVLLRQKHFFLPAGRFLTSKGGTGYRSWSTGLERRAETLNADATAVMAASEEDWAQRTPVVWTTGYTSEQIPNDNRVSESRKILDDGKVARTAYQYEPVVEQTRINNQSEVAEYDYDNTLKRRTVTSYSATNYVNGVNYADDSIHLLALPLQQSVFDGTTADTERARTVYKYDIYADDGNNYPLTLYPAPVTGHDTANFGAGRAARGNVTRVGRWLKASNTYLDTYTRYDMLGNAVSVKDGNGNVSTVSYADDFGDGSNPGGGAAGAQGPTYALPTLFTSPAPNPGEQPHTARAQYDFRTGLLAGFRDRNGVVTQTVYNDPFDRPTLVKTALGVPGVEARTATYYAPATAFGVTLAKNDVLTATDLNATGDATLRSWMRTDGFGRTTEAWRRDPQGDVQVVTAYDGLGRAAKVSYPLRPSRGETPRYANTSYDLLGRVVAVTTPDTAAVTTAYSGNRVTVTDQSGRKRRSVTDALGRLVRVDEPDASSGGLDDASGNPVQPTFYTYDALGNLRKVDQGGQLRFFMYDSLSRLIRAKNPEQGSLAADADFPALTDSSSGVSNGQWSVGYLYDANGNLTKRKDARGVTATYAYDALNRNKSVDYSDATPDVTRTYDGAIFGKGRLWKSEAAQVAQTTVEQYDEVGRPRRQAQKFWAGGAWGQGYTTQLAYNLAGGVTSMVYPSGHTVSYNYDVAGRLGDSGTQPAFSGDLGDGVTRTYASEVRYHAGGGMEQERYGAETPVYNKHLYNGRNQLAEIRLSTYAITSAGHETDWNRGAIINHYSTAPGAWGATGGGADNNGNLQKQEVYIPADDRISSYTNVVQEYGYDALNRLTAVYDKPSNGSPDFYQLYRYDRWGNRTIDPGSWNAPAPQFTVDAATNRLGVPAGQAGVMGYDAAGNLTYDSYQGGQGGGGSRAFDAENRMTSAQFFSGQAQTASYTYDADGRRVKRNTGAGEVWQVYGAGGELLAEYAAGAAPTQPQKEYGYRGGELLVTAAQATVQTVTPVNLAQGKTATQSSTLAYTPPGDAWHAVDGNTNGNYFSGSVTHTNGDSQAWWQVDLGAVQSIGSIDLWNRTDCCSDRLSNFYVFVSDVPFASTDVAQTQAQAGVWSSYTSGQAPTRTTLAVNRTGRYVRVQLAGTGILSLAEVQVWGTQNLAAGKAASQSSTLVYNPPGDAWHAVDGNTDGNYFSGSVTHTNGEVRPWWQVDLGAVRALERVAVWNRTDCCSERLTDFYVLVSDAPFASTDLNATLGQAGVSAYRVAGQGGRPTKVSVNRTGRYVRVQLAGSGTGILSLAEVQVWGGDSMSTTQTADLRWLVTDQVGTPRMVVDRTGSLAGVTRHDYLPFGEEIYANTGGRLTTQGYGAEDRVRQKFAGYESDGETRLDYAQARYYSPAQGRFVSTDPYNIIGEVQAESDPEKARKKLDTYLSEPQQWNRYAYTINNPLRYVDPSGEVIVLTGTAEEQAAAYERIKRMLGEERMRFVQMGADGNGNIVLSILEKDVYKFAAIGGNNVDEREFSSGMATILATSKIVEFRIAETYEAKCNGCANFHTYRTDETGGITLAPHQTRTGNVQIFVHPRSAEIATSMKSKLEEYYWGKGELIFTNEMGDAHEFGHAHTLLFARITRIPSYADPQSHPPLPFAQFENAVRSRYPSGKRRGNIE